MKADLIVTRTLSSLFLGFYCRRRRILFFRNIGRPARVPIIPNPSSTTDDGSGIAAIAVCPSTTTLSIRLFPLDEVAPLNTMRNVALGLLFKPEIPLKSKTKGDDPNAEGGT